MYCPPETVPHSKKLTPMRSRLATTTVATHSTVAEAHSFVMPQSTLTEANDTDASDSEDIEDEEDEEEEEEVDDEDEEEEEEGKEGEVVKTRAKKWGNVEKKTFKTLVENGELKIDGDSKHREHIRLAYWPNRKPETFRRNWLASTAEFRVAAFKNGARAKSAGKGKNEFMSCHFAAPPYLTAYECTPIH